jgi:hypothetical protein
MRLVGLADAQPDADCEEHLDGVVGACGERLRDERRRAGGDRRGRKGGCFEDLRRE